MWPPNFDSRRGEGLKFRIGSSRACDISLKMSLQDHDFEKKETVLT